MNSERPVRRQSFLPGVVLLIVWASAAALLGSSGVLLNFPVPLPIVALGVAAGLLVVLRFASEPRRYVRSLGLAPLLGIHLIRLVAGAYFLWLHARGDLRAEFALPAGWGDILVSLGACAVLVFAVPADDRRKRIALLTWNTLGLIDMLGVLGNAMRLFVQDSAFGTPFTELPLALLPVFVVPIILATHVLIFVWYAKPGGMPSQVSRN